MNWQAALCFVTLTAHCPVNGLTVRMNGNAVSGQTVNLLITPASGFITSTVVVTKPDSSVAGICVPPNGGSHGLCTPSADFSQDFATGLTTFSISALSRATDEGIWTCSHGTEEETIDIKVLTLPIAINAPSPAIPAFTLSNGVTSVQYFFVTVSCAYPSASLTWVFIPVHGGSAASAQSSPAASCTSTGNAGCPDTDANSYTCTVRPQYNADLAGQKVYLTARLTLTGEYQSTGMTLHITDTEITMQATSTETPTTTPTTTESSGIGNRPSVGLSDDCGQHSADAICAVSNSACVMTRGGQWICQCTKHFIYNGSECIQTPTRILDTSYGFTISSDAAVGTKVGTIPLLHVEGVSINGQLQLIPTYGGFHATFDNTYTNIALIKSDNSVFIQPVRLTLVVTMTLSDVVVTDTSDVTITPSITTALTREITLAEGTRQGSFVAEVPGLNKYTSLDVSSFTLKGEYDGFFNVDNHGDIYCAKSIFFADLSLTDDVYAILTHLDIMSLSPQSATIARLSLLIVRDAFSRRILENTQPSTDIAVFEGMSDHLYIDLINTGSPFGTYFDFDRKSGILHKSTHQLDYENTSTRAFKFEFRLTWNSNDMEVVIPGAILVEDVNDNPPVFTEEYPIFQVLSGSPAQTFVGVVRATDADTVGEVTYHIVDNVYSDVVTVTQHGGAIISNQVLSTKHHELRFKVLAKDGEHTAECNVTIDVIKLDNDNPNLALTFNGTLDEELSPPVFVASVFVQKYTNFKFLSSRENPNFELNSSTGIVSTRLPLDRENLPSDFHGNSVRYGIQAQQDSGSITILGELTVTVEDVNDNSPCFRMDNSCQTNAHFEGSVRENSTDELEVTLTQQIQLYDPDEVDDGKLTFSPTSDDHFRFVDDSSVIRIFTRPDAPLDREKTGTITVLIHVRDSGHHMHTSTATVNITVVDINDNPPVFDVHEYLFSVQEDSPVTTSIGQILATDADQGLNGDIRYSLFSSFFSIDENTGRIKTRNPLDRESVGMFSLTVTARDHGPQSLTATATVSVSITDINDNAPVFGRPVYRLPVYENSDCSISLGSVAATDADIGKNGEVNFNISDPNTFSIKQTGALFCVHTLDYESKSSYQIVVTAIDGGIPAKSSTTKVFIDILDKNDNPPVFTQNVTSVNTTRNDFSSLNRPIALVGVTDNDSGDNGRFQLTLCDEYRAYFAIADNGVMSINNNMLPGDSLDILCTINATDYGSPPMTSSAYVKFNIDRNIGGDSGVAFNKNDFVFSQIEKDAGQTKVGQLSIHRNTTKMPIFAIVSALDGEVVNNNLTAGGVSFYLDPGSGIITKSGVLDRETRDVYLFFVSVEDQSQKAYALVTVNVTDVNECPQFLTQREQFGVNEDVVHKVIHSFNPPLAEDKDLADNGSISFHIIHQEPFIDNEYKFGVDTAHGNLSVVSALDYETTSRYNITVEVRDHGVPSLSATRVFNIRVIDVNDNPPTFQNVSAGGNCYAVSVPEDSRILGLNITIDDKDTHYRETRLSIENPEDCPLAPVANSNEEGMTKFLQSNDTMDYEMRTFYTCWIVATNVDSPHLANNCSLLVTVLDVNDNVPQTHGPYHVRVTNGKINDIIVVINATDIDSGENGRLVYSFMDKGDNYRSFFAIDSTTGIIRTAKDLFQLTVAYVILTVDVSDNGSPSQANTTQVTVTILSNNTEPWFPAQGGDCRPNGDHGYSQMYRGSVLETFGPVKSGDMPNTDLFRVTACDKDGGQFVECNCTYGFVDGPNDDFEIDPSTGMIRQLRQVDRETTPEFRFNVSATGHGYPPRQSLVYATLAISVDDVDDNPPTFEQYPFEFNISNTMDVGDEFGPVRAVDPDAGINSASSYTFSFLKPGPFVYNTSSGYFKVTETLTNLTDVSFTGILTATGVATPTYMYSTGVLINIYYEDPNIYTPVFSKGVYEVTIPFSAKKGHGIGTFIARDNDTGIYGQIRYGLRGNCWETFSLDVNRGNVSLTYAVIDNIPYHMRMVNLTLVATDGGDPPKKGLCVIRVRLVGDENARCTSDTGASQQSPDTYQTPLYVVTGVAVCLLLGLVLGFLVMFYRNRVTISKHNTTLPRLSTITDSHELQANTYQKLDKSRHSGEYETTFERSTIDDYLTPP